jgi:hypothetical protein
LVLSHQASCLPMRVAAWKSPNTVPEKWLGGAISPDYLRSCRQSAKIKKKGR